jgi:hypothetical protein
VWRWQLSQANIVPRHARTLLPRGVSYAAQTPELQLARRAISARLQRLPAGVVAQPITRRIVAACDACGEELETEDNLLVECDMCRWVYVTVCVSGGGHTAP